MRSHFVKWGISVVAVLSCAYFLRAQTAQPSGGAQAGAAAAAKTATAAAWKVPKTSWGEPDFEGMWEPKEPASAREFAGYSFVSHKDVVPLMTAWGKQQYEMTKPSWGPRAVEDSTDMVNPTTGSEIGCAPTGVPRIWVHPFPTKIVQTRGALYLLHEFNHETREIYTNKGRVHDKDLDPLWMGNPLGWWEGDTLVIDSVGFNGKTWIDRAGLPSSDQLHVIERLSRPTPQRLHVDITVDDPKAYTKPIVGSRDLILEPGWPITEMICEDNITFNDLKNQGREQ